MYCVVEKNSKLGFHVRIGNNHFLRFFFLFSNLNMQVWKRPDVRSLSFKDICWEILLFSGQKKRLSSRRFDSVRDSVSIILAWTNLSFSCIWQTLPRNFKKFNIFHFFAMKIHSFKNHDFIQTIADAEPRWNQSNFVSNGIF